MDEIIYLEPDEEITSVIDKLKTLDPNLKAISLVVPKGAAILQSVVNLKLLQKEGQALSKDLSIVTQDRIGRNLASQAGFTVFDNINSPKPTIEPPRPQPKTEEIIELDLTDKKEDEEKAPGGIAVHRYDNSYISGSQIESKPKFAPEPTLPSSLREKTQHNTTLIRPISPEGFSKFGSAKSTSSNSQKMKIILAVFGCLVILAFTLFYILYPKAILTLGVKSESLDASVEVIVDNNISKADEARSAIPGTRLEAEQQGGKKFTATGKKDVGEKARGTITTSNESGEIQKVTAGAEYKSDAGLIFNATSDTNIPGATASVDAHGNVTKTSGKADVAVEASESGNQYNLGPTNFSVAGKNMLNGKNANPMSGGISKQVTIVSQNDINSAKSELTKEISSVLHDELKKKAGKDKIYDSSIKDEVVSSETSIKAGDEAENFETKVKVKSVVISFGENDFREMIVKSLQKSIPADRTLSLSPQDEISIINAETDTSTGLLKLKGNVKTKTIPKINAEKITQSIRGKTTSQAETIVKENKNIESVNIRLNPSWILKKIPNREKNIIVEFEYK